MRHIILLFTFFNIFYLHAQIVTLSPQGAGPEESVTLTFDANEGNKELIGASKVY